MERPKIIDDRAKYKSQIPTKTVNSHEYVAIHYKGVTKDVTGLYGGGYGGHFDVKWDGEIHQNASITDTIWAVGAGTGWKYLHPTARNASTISIEGNVHCDGNASSIHDKQWYYTDATQESMARVAAWLLFDVLRYPLNKQTIEAYLLRHGDITSKPCPAPYFAAAGYKTNWGWTEFKNRVFEIAVKDRKEAEYMFTCKQISNGSRCNDVLLWQRLMVAMGYKGADGKPLAQDGIFGHNTEYATRNFQTAQRIGIDGIVGPITWGKGLGV